MAIDIRCGATAGQIAFSYSPLSAFLSLAGAALVLLSMQSTSLAAVQMATKGAFDVSETGAATYSIPIRIPKGVAGIEPKISINYNSQGVNGLLGVGWSLGGMSAISRCPQTYSRGENPGRVSLTKSDRYCLDGVRLMLVSGVDGADGAVYRTEKDSFSRIVSNGSQAATGQYGPASFTVTTKSGLTLKYGATVNSRIEAQGQSEGAGTVRVWALSEVKDVAGNYMSYSYVKDNSNGLSSNGQYYPVRIDYTGNTQKPAPNGTAPMNSVNFEYDTNRSDVISNALAGTFVKNTARLKRVWTSTTRTVNSSNLISEVAEWRLQYESAGSPATKRSRLSTVTECDGAGVDATCLPPVALGWSGSAPTFDTSLVQLPADLGVPVQTQLITGDFNGDGKTDFLEVAGSNYYVFLSQPNGVSIIPQTFPNGLNVGLPSTYQLVIGDFNGDGKTDFAEISGTKYYVFLSNGDGSFISKSPVGGSVMPNSWNFAPSSNFAITAADFNGDGLTDFVQVGIAGAPNGILYMLTSKGDGTFAGYQVNPAVTIPAATLYSGAPTASSVALSAADYDGDGVADIIISYSCATASASPCGAGYYLQGKLGTFAKATTNNTPISLVIDNGQMPRCGALNQPFGSIVDINGDGLPDCAIQGTGTSFYSVLNLGAGVNPVAGTSTRTTSYNATPPTSFASIPGPIYGDFNGDGLTDYLRILDTKYTVWTSDGVGGFTSITQTLPGGFDFAPYTANGAILTQVIQGDFNGDGRSDFALLAKDKLYFFYASGAYPDVVTKIVPAIGLAGEINITYEHMPLAKANGNYVVEMAAAAQTIPLISSNLLVTKVDVQNSKGTYNSSTFKYGDGRLEIGLGRGFLGFRWFERYDDRTKMYSRSYFRQDWPYTGLIDKVAQYEVGPTWSSDGSFNALGSGFYKLTANTYSCFDSSSVTYDTSGKPVISPCAGWISFIANTQVIESGRDLAGNLTPRSDLSQILDEFGNPVQVTHIIRDAGGAETGYKKVIKNTYFNDASSAWRIGRLIKSTVEATSPD